MSKSQLIVETATGQSTRRASPQASTILSFPLRQVVKDPTRCGSILDKIYTNADKWYSKPIILPPVGKSDHNAVLLVPNSPVVNVKGAATPMPYVYRSYDSNGKTLLAHDLKNFNWTELYSMDSCEHMLSYFYTVCHRFLDYRLPLLCGYRYPTDKPWVTDSFRTLVRHRQSAWKNQNWSQYRYYRNKAQREAKLLKQKYYKRRAQLLRRVNPRKWWREVKKLTGHSVNEPFAALIHTSYDGDLQHFCNDVNDFLKSVSDDLQPLDKGIIPDVSYRPHEFVIFPYEVESKLSKIDGRKSCGPDELPNWFLREFSVWLAEPLTAIFNASLCEGHVPLEWKLANVVPLPKQNPPRDITSDIRPISLTASLSKVLESFVSRWVLDLIDKKLDRKQFGGLRGKSTTHALIDMIHHWISALDKGKSVRLLFVDYAKAFDHVDHSTVVRKLINLGVPDFLIRWICSFLTDRQQRVKLRDVFSSWVQLSGSMPQGSLLGPLTFIVLIDDLNTDCMIHKFVDDTTLSEFTDKGQASQMDVNVTQLLNWSSNNHMNVNFKKTKEMLINTSHCNLPDKLSVADVEIERVNVFKLLGVHINRSLKWDDHVSAICNKAASRIYFLKQLKRSSVDPDDLYHFYTTVIRPILEYACPVWHSGLTVEHSNRIEAIQKRAFRLIFGSFDYLDFCSRNGLSTLYERRDLLARQFFQSILNKSSCLNYLLPEERSDCVIGKLRHPSIFKLPHVHTTRSKTSFINYALDHYI